MRIVALGVMLMACGSVGVNPTPDAPVMDGPLHDSATCAMNPPDLGGRWRGEMNANDDKGRYNGTPIGNALRYAPGKHGSAFLLDGLTNVISIDDGEALWPTGSFSLEAWVKTASTGSIVTKYECGNSCPAGLAEAFWNLSVDRNGAAAFTLRADEGDTTLTITDPSSRHVNDEQWHHLVGVRDVTARKMILYVDGVFVVSTNPPLEQLGRMTNTDGETDPIVIGGGVNAASSVYGSLLKGSIDEISYYASALTDNQVAAIYSAPDGECH